MEIKDLNKYVREGLDKGEFSVRRYVKSSRIHAAPGVPGEQIDTILKNGLKETWNIVGTDGTGQGSHQNPHTGETGYYDS